MQSLVRPTQGPGPVQNWIQRMPDCSTYQYCQKTPPCQNCLIADPASADDFGMIYRRHLLDCSQDPLCGQPHHLDVGQFPWSGFHPGTEVAVRQSLCFCCRIVPETLHASFEVDHVNETFRDCPGWRSCPRHPSPPEKMIHLSLHG